MGVIGVYIKFKKNHTYIGTLPCYSTRCWDKCNVACILYFFTIVTLQLHLEYPFNMFKACAHFPDKAHTPITNTFADKGTLCLYILNVKMSLEGKVCIVTGASRGIGRGIALQLGAAGATIYITGKLRSGIRTCVQINQNLQVFMCCEKK